MITDSQHKQLMRATKDQRDELIQKLIKHPHSSETATLIIGCNELLRVLWHYLGNEERYEDEFYIYSP